MYVILNFLVGCETLIWALLILRSSYCSSILTISIAYKVLMITGAKFTWFYGALWFCGFNKWNFETSKSTFDIQFIIFRFWNEGLGERSSSSYTYALSLQLDSHSCFEIFGNSRAYFVAPVVTGLTFSSLNWSRNSAVTVLGIYR